MSKATKSIKNRKQELKKIGPLYSRLKNVNLDKCFYCNSARECLDHCPPIRVAIRLDIDLYLKAGNKLVLIPACNQCNSILGSKRLFTPFEKVVYLKDKYMKLIDKYNYEWSDDEIKELGYNLKMHVLQRELAVRELITKYRNIEDKFLEMEFEGLK